MIAAVLNIYNEGNKGIELFSVQTFCLLSHGCETFDSLPIYLPTVLHFRLTAFDHEIKKLGTFPFRQELYRLI